MLTEVQAVLVVTQVSVAPSAHDQQIRGGGELGYFEGVILFPQQKTDPLVLHSFITADPMALIYDQQRIFIPELIQIRRYTLHTGEGNLMPVFP